MGAENISAILEVKGSLCINPTDLSADFPHGGTSLGLVRAISVLPNQRSVPLTAEEYGGETVEEVELGRSWTLTAAVRSFDDDVLALVFPNTEAGASTGSTVVNDPGTTDAERPGHLLSTRSVVLLFSPDDLQNHKMVLFYRALPLVDDALELTFSLGEETTLGVVFKAIRDGSNRMMSLGYREDLTL